MVVAGKINSMASYNLCSGMKLSGVSLSIIDLSRPQIL